MRPCIHSAFSQAPVCAESLRHYDPLALVPLTTNEAQRQLLKDDADVLVNPVNIVGVMGKGLALQFKQAFPTNFSAYRSACRRRELQAGVILAVRVDDRWIVNLPTKRHWRQPSRLSDVAAGLDGLVEFLLSNPVDGVAIPPLGAGNGGLSWPRVRDLIHEKLEGLDLSIRLCQPAASVR